MIDRAAADLTECAKAVKARVNISIQAQSELVDDLSWYWYGDRFGTHPDYRKR